MYLHQIYICVAYHFVHIQTSIKASQRQNAKNACDTQEKWCLRFRNIGTQLTSLLYKLYHRRKRNSRRKAIVSLPRLSGQMAKTTMSVGNEQKRSTKKFVLQRKYIIVSTIYRFLTATDSVASRQLFLICQSIKVVPAMLDSFSSLRQNNRRLETRQQQRDIFLPTRIFTPPPPLLPACEGYVVFHVHDVTLQGYVQRRLIGY